MIGVDNTQTRRVVRASRVEKETGDGEILSGLVQKTQWDPDKRQSISTSVTLLQANYRQG